MGPVPYCIVRSLDEQIQPVLELASSLSRHLKSDPSVRKVEEGVLQGIAGTPFAGDHSRINA